jgi:predicted DNA-binding ribbon-helix-helix protein
MKEINKMAQISKKIVNLQDFSNRLDKMLHEVRRAKLACDAVSYTETDFVLLSYVAEFERAEKAFTRISNGFEELDEAAQQGQLKASYDVDLYSLIEERFGEDPMWESIVQIVRERLKTTSVNVIATIANEIMCCRHTLFNQLPKGEKKRRKKSNLLSFLELCGLKPVKSKPPTNPPKKKHWKKLAIHRLAIAPQVPLGYKRVHAWPMHIRPDLANKMKFRTVAVKDEYKESNKRRERFDKVYKHIETFLKEHEYTNPKTGQSTTPILIEELNYLRTTTVNALHKANIFTISDLVTFDEKKPFDLRKVKRIAAGKVLELQIALSEVGIYRNGRAWFSLGKPKDPSSVKDLPASPTQALMRFFKGKVKDVSSDCFKATNVQDELGMTWYDKQFGHMPYLYEEEINDPKVAEHVKNKHGVYGVPLSVYGKVQGREHPHYWKDDVELQVLPFLDEGVKDELNK